LSKKGEKITTLDGASHELNENLLITDGASGTPLGIAGVKGGKVAEVDENTTDIILEAAHFDPVHTRKTSRGLKLRTDASLRFENNPSAELTLYALEEVTKIILDISGGTYIGTIDIYGAPQEGVEVSVTVDEVNKLLGTSLTEKQVEEILKQLGFEYTSSGGNFTVKSPFERTDLHITEDLIEEIGRVYGYRNIEAQSLPKLERALEMNKAFFYGEKVRNALVESGFSEVYTYTLFDKGEIELANPLASDKGVMRPSLARGLGDSLVLNSNNAALLGLSLIKIFELGIVFTKEGENTELGIGILPLNTKKVESASKDIFSSLQKVMSDALGTSVEGELKDGIFTINFNELIKDLREPKEYEPLRVGGSEAKYKPISQYPFALRDIAVWTSEGTKPEDVLTIVKEKAGELLLNHSLFDQFEKEGKISYAFHLVFQSYEKTLSEKEINDVMESMTSALNKKEGWEVR